MPSLTIRLTETQLEQLKECASKNNMDVTGFILNSCGVSNANDLTIQDVINKVNAIPVGDKFSIKSLYDYQTWANFTKNSKLSVGRTFYKSLSGKKLNLHNLVKFIEKNSSNIAIYERI